MTDIGDGLTLTTHNGMGYLMAMRGNICVADECPDAYARAAQFSIEAHPYGKTVAWIGGGLCVGPAMFARMDCLQVVFEIEPALREFCPKGVSFIAGDWRDTLAGQYDVIVYDLGGDVPRDDLIVHLRPGGIILPLEDGHGR